MVGGNWSRARQFRRWIHKDNLNELANQIPGRWAGSCPQSSTVYTCMSHCWS